MIKLVIHIKGEKKPVVREIVNQRQQEMELAHMSCAKICQQGIYVPDEPEESYPGSTLIAHIKGRYEGDGENGTWYPPHSITCIKIHEQ